MCGRGGEWLCGCVYVGVCFAVLISLLLVPAWCKLVLSIMPTWCALCFALLLYFPYRSYAAFVQCHECMSPLLATFFQWSA